MMNSIHDGDLILMTGIYSKSQIHRFDVVDVRNKTLKEDMIKRIIGLPGEEVAFKNDHLYINDRYMKEPFLKKSYIKDQLKKYQMTQYTNDFKIQLRRDEYFILGDHRPMSYDSRYFGPVHLEDIRAKNGYIIYPMKHIKITNKEKIWQNRFSGTLGTWQKLSEKSKVKLN